MRGFASAVVLSLFFVVGCGGGDSSPTSPSPSPDSTPSGPTRIISITGSLAFGNVTVGQTRDLSFTISNSGNSTLTVSNLSISSGLGSIYTSDFASGGTIAAGGSRNVLVRFAPTAAQAYNGTIQVNADHTSGTNTIAVSGTGTTSQSPSPAPSGTSVVINEFRSRGPNGATDEFIELRNDTSSTVDISGWQIVGSNGSGSTEVRRIIDSGITLGPGCHYLLTNSNSPGYSGSVAGDSTYGVAVTDDGGIALTRPNGSIEDQVGMSSGSAYREGTPLLDFGDTNSNRSYARTGNDTNNNRSDFSMTSPSTPQNRLSSCSVR